ncbi:MAG: hypothetical protein ACOC9T_03260 [Myxococcota bacterium]
MTLETGMVYVNLVVGAAAFTIYGLWAGKWLRRGAWALFALNLVTAIGVGGFALGYASIAIDSEGTSSAQIVFRYLVPIAIGLPVWARILEYRRDQHREDYAHDAMQRLAVHQSDAV